MQMDNENLGKKEVKIGQGVLSCFEWTDSLITAIIIVVVLFTVVVRIPEVWGPSMLPSLEENDRVLTMCLDRNFHQDDVVIVDAKGTSLNERIVKRVIATEGQTIDIDFTTGIVSVDGVELDESAYIENGITKDASDVEFPQTVPNGCVFVLGDNREVSLDSRDWRVGMVDCRNIIGKAEYIVYPFNHFGKIKG